MTSPIRSVAPAFLSTLAALCGGLCPPAHAGTPIDVAIVAAANPTAADIRFTDPQAKLLSTGFFNTVDIIAANLATPTLVQLQAYDAVIVWSNVNFLDSVALGDVLADYVDAGGGVVLTVFAVDTTSTARYLRGRWETGGYGVIVVPGANTGGAASLGTIHQPGHPLVAGVATVGGTSNNRPTNTALTPGGIRIADWSDGKTLIALHGTFPNRVDLGMYPPSSAVVAGYWDAATTDGELIMANALVYTASQGVVGTPYCFGDGSGTPCPCTPVPLVGDADKGCPNGFNAGGGKLEASGVASLGADTLVMTCTTINNGGAVVFQGTTDNGGGLGTAFGDGLRCAAGTVRRMRSHQVTTNTHQYPDPAFADNAISIRGAVLAPGDRYYQGWYRSGLAHCEPTQNYNLTNGVRVTWVP